MLIHLYETILFYVYCFCHQQVIKGLVHVSVFYLHIFYKRQSFLIVVKKYPSHQSFKWLFNHKILHSSLDVLHNFPLTGVLCILYSFDEARNFCLNMLVHQSILKTKKCTIFQFRFYSDFDNTLLTSGYLDVVQPNCCLFCTKLLFLGC